MIWNQDHIVSELARLHQSGDELSYNRMSRANQSLVSAAAYHFGSYRDAVIAAGIDYAEVSRRPRWTRENVVEAIRDASRKGDDLNWSSVTRRGDDLAKAAFAAIQPRLFGRWDRALEAAGLDVADVSPYRSWDKPTIASGLKARSVAGEPMNSGAVQKADPALHAAAVRYFGGFDRALRAAKLDPDAARGRRRWSADLVVRELKAIKKAGTKLGDGSVRRDHPALHGAAVRLFGSYAAAREAASGKNGKHGSGKNGAVKRAVAANAAPRELAVA